MIENTILEELAAEETAATTPIEIEETGVEEVMENEGNFITNNMNIIGYVLTSISSMAVGYGIKWFQSKKAQEKQLKDIRVLIEAVYASTRGEAFEFEGQQYDITKYNVTNVHELQGFIMNEVLADSKTKPEIKKQYRELLAQTVKLATYVENQRIINEKIIVSEDEGTE